MDILSTPYKDIFRDEVEIDVYHSIFNDLELLKKQQEGKEEIDTINTLIGSPVNTTPTSEALQYHNMINTNIDIYVKQDSDISTSPTDLVPVVTDVHESTSSSSSSSERFLEDDILLPSMSDEPFIQLKKLKQRSKTKRKPSATRKNKKRKIQTKTQILVDPDLSEKSQKLLPHSSFLTRNLSNASSLTNKIHEKMSKRLSDSNGARKANAVFITNHTSDTSDTANASSRISSPSSSSLASSTSASVLSQDTKVQKKLKTLHEHHCFTPVEDVNSSNNNVKSASSLSYEISFMRKKLCDSMEKSTESRWQLMKLIEKPETKNEKGKKRNRKGFEKNSRCLLSEMFVLEQLAIGIRNSKILL